MSSNKKFALSLVAMVMAAVIAVVTIVAVFAASTQKLSTNISVRYRADQIEGSVTAKYYVGPLDTEGTDMTTDDEGETTLTFHAKDTDMQGKSLSPNKNIELQYPDDGVEDKSWVVFEYVFHNGLGTHVDTDYVAKLSFSGTADNIKITTLSADTQLKDFSKITGKVSTPANFTAEVVVEHNDEPNYISTQYFYVKAEIDNPGDDSTFSGNFDWNLSVDTSTVIREIYDASTQKFNVKNLNKLLQRISGDGSVTTSNMEKINTLAASKTTAAQMRQFSEGKAEGEDITVTIGGLKWTVTYLSQDKDGNPILTLWLDNCIQDAWTGRSSTEGEYYGFLNGGLYSDWSAHWYDTRTIVKYPANLYGASYIRAVTLNNGGVYSTFATDLSEDYKPNPDSAFALFTMEESELTKYIVKPKNVAWQENGEFAKTQIQYQQYNLSNENWSKTLLSTGFFSMGCNYASKDYSDTWSNDYLWLPSLTETGYSDTKIGIWDLSVAQRYNADGSTSEVGRSGAVNYYWLRSSYEQNGNASYALHPSGADYAIRDTDRHCAVRPAFHLNLALLASAV